MCPSQEAAAFRQWQIFAAGIVLCITDIKREVACENYLDGSDWCFGGHPGQ